MTLQHDLFIQQQRSEIRQEFATRSQGAEANHKGQELEQQVRALFTARGATIVPYTKFSRCPEDMFAGRLLVPQFRYKGAMRQTTKADLVYFHGNGGARVGIECKVQDGNGSADEKLFVAYHNALKWEFADHIWFVMSGRGFRQPIVNWLERHAAADFPSNKTFRLFRGLEDLRVAVQALVVRGVATERG